MNGAETTFMAMELEKSGYRFEYDRARKGWTCWDVMKGWVSGPYETLHDAVESILQRYDDGLEE